jgi:ABC-2 type transport system ATP-binding protein
MNAGPALIMEGVCKRFNGLRALSSVDLQIEPGEIVVLLGANGAGKTTLMSIAAALSRPDSGTVWVDGVNMLKQPSRGQRRLGIATQQTGVYPTLSVRDNLRFFGELAGLRRGVLDRRLEEVADAFDLIDMLDRPTRLLSVGQARRLHTAMILLHPPPLLLLDEPTAGVDVATRARMLELVGNLAADGSAICYSSHYLMEVDQLEANVAIIHGGRIIARGSPEALISTHGQSAVELRFSGAPPSLSDIGFVQTSGTTMRVAIDHEPELDIAGILATLGASAKHLQGVKLIQPDLESVFRSLTEQQVLRRNHDELEVYGGLRS